MFENTMTCRIEVREKTVVPRLSDANNDDRESNEQHSSEDNRIIDSHCSFVSFHRRKVFSDVEFQKNYEPHCY
jgi:hypothetical protein